MFAEIRKKDTGSFSVLLFIYLHFDQEDLP